MQTYIRDSITGFSPTVEDLDYPAKLATTGSGSQQVTGEESSVSSSTLLKALRKGYESWYPTLERTLMMLSKLYRSVDIKIFEGLAQEAVLECTGSLVSASRGVSAKHSR